MAIYMWREYTPRTPPSDVLAYFPLDSTYQLNSQDWQKTMTASGSGYSFDSKCVEINDSTKLSYNTSIIWTSYSLFCWMQNFWYIGMSSGTKFSNTYYRNINHRWDTTYRLSWWNGGTSWDSSVTITSWWHSFVLVSDSSRDEAKVFVDWILSYTQSKGINTNMPNLLINTIISGFDVAKVWVSNIQRTATEALDFHNWTKWDYWL